MELDLVNRPGEPPRRGYVRLVTAHACSRVTSWQLVFVPQCNVCGVDLSVSLLPYPPTPLFFVIITSHFGRVVCSGCSVGVVIYGILSLSAECPLGVISALSGCGGLALQLLPSIRHGKGEGLTTPPGTSANLMGDSHRP